MELDQEITLKIDELLELFMQKHEPEEISRWEEHHNYVWVTMIPFVHLVFAGGWFPITTAKQGANEEVDRDHAEDFDPQPNTVKRESVDGGVASGSIVVPFKSADVSCSEGLLEMFGTREGDVSNEPSSSGNISHAQIHDACLSIDRSASTLKNPAKTVKSQESVAKEASDAVMYGSLSVQRFGIFCLRHMLRLGENCVLIESENLLPYLVCLCWFLEKDEKDLLKEALKKFQHVPPPTLKIIAKSSMAMKEGLESVYGI